MIEEMIIETPGQGLVDITDRLVPLVNAIACQQGLCTVFVTHTSASLTIQENADPSARRDLENWLNRLVPEHDDLYSHTTEGADDMPAHIKAMLTSYLNQHSCRQRQAGSRYLAGALPVGAPPLCASSTSAGSCWCVIRRREHSM